MDLPGFGHSQRRDSLLSPEAMGEFVIAAADAFGLERPHVVAPGTGTAAALFAAARHPGRLRSLVVGSGAAAVPLQVGGMVKEIIEAPDLDGFRCADPRQLVTAALSGVSRYTLPEAVRDDYLACYQGNRFAVYAPRDLRSYPADLPVLAGLLPRIDTPVQMIAGAGESAVPPVNASFLHERLPHSKLDIIDAGHFTLGRRRIRLRGPGHRLVAGRGQRIKEMSTMPGPDHDTGTNLLTTALPLAASATVPECELHGRRGEREMLDRLVAEVRAGQSRVLVLRGEPGTGKTALVDYLARRAAGCRVARVTGVEAETEMAFAGLHQLCAPFLGLLGHLPDPQRDALRIAFNMQGGKVPDRFAVGMATLSLLSDLAIQRPLVCVVDDAQWLDQASAQALAFVARHLAAAPGRGDLRGAPARRRTGPGRAARVSAPRAGRRRRTELA